MYLPNSYELFWNSSAEGFRELNVERVQTFLEFRTIRKSKGIES